MNYTFLKSSYYGKFKFAKIFAKLIKTKFVFKKKLKMCKFPLTASVRKFMQNFFAKIVQSASFCSRLSNEYLRVTNENLGPPMKT